MKQKIALISCATHLPVSVYHNLVEKGFDVHIIKLKEVETDLPPHLTVSLGQIGRIFNYLKNNKIQDIILAGRISRPNLCSLRFDLQGLKLAFRLLSKLRCGDDKLLRFIENYISNQGFALRSIADMCFELVMPEGCLTKVEPTKDQLKSIEFGQAILNDMSKFDIGQSVAVSGGVVMGIETLAGTDAMIKAVGNIEFERKQGLSKPIFIKMRKKGQSNALDLPTIGTDTIHNLVSAGFAGAAFEAGGCLVMDYDTIIQEANKNKLFIIGIDNKHD